MSGKTIQHVFNVLPIIIIASLVRLFLLHSEFKSKIESRVELSTPVNSWIRATEGVKLMKMNISPYDGDTFHESPLLLYFYRFLIDNSQFVPIIFVLTDLLTSGFLALASYLHLKNIIFHEKDRLEKLKYEDKERLRIDENVVITLSLRVFAIYLLLPYSFLSCAAKSTSLFSNLIVSFLMVTSALKLRAASFFLVALLAYNSLYPIMLIFPVFMLINSNRKMHQLDDYLSKSNLIKLFNSIIIVSCFLISLIWLSHYLMNGNWDFIPSTYGFLLTVPDFTPNIGLFWYFFTEMFDHFREFFLWTFQINSFVYTLPLALTLRRNPPFFFFILLIIFSLFKPYPSISDASLYLSLLPQWQHLFKYTKQGLIVSCILVSCSVIAPIMWYMWIILGTANSNYYFGVTLAYNLAQIFLMTDFLFAFAKREYHLDNGIQIDKNGNEVRVKLEFD